ncbi:MAG TPA: ribosome recycling factor [bacterium]|nr:ribosome recycling factor [bacterium]HMW32255.1 ribosome recycling factor [bacterium]HMW35393.1 ribosome recycling factor [bacterium]HMY34848.1 ribosome recycling factor [bacterium]HMZ03391.1 ribosome recycling factor [bacterium]
MYDLNKQYHETEEKMKKSLETVRNELAKIRSGRATTTLLDGVKVDYYGTPTPLNQVGNVSAPEARLLTVQPWEKGMVPAIEKAIREANLGLNPQNDGALIRIPIPPLNEERRKELVKLGKKYAEEGKVAVRNVRRDANEHFKKAEKDHKISEDDSKDAQDKVQKMTDNYIKKIDEMLVIKEKEIMEV